MIEESNQDITLMVKHLDSKVLLLRTKYPNSPSLKKIERFYKIIIIPWMEEFQMIEKEVDRQEDEELKNLILDWFNKINSILEK